jgi:hypothetical protein
VTGGLGATGIVLWSIPGILLWSMPGIAAGAGFVAGLAAGFAAGFVAGILVALVAGLAAALAAVVLPVAPAPAAGSLVIRGMSVFIEDIPGICAIMRFSTGSVITRSRITGSAIMRMWMAIIVESSIRDTFVLELDAPAAPPDAPVPDMFMPE